MGLAFVFAVLVAAPILSLFSTSVPDPDLLQAILDEARTRSHLQCA